MCGRVTFRLAKLPNFAGRVFHPEQVTLYSRFTELTFKALTLPSAVEFMEQLAENLGLEDVQVRVLRMPAPIRRVDLVQKEGKLHLIGEYRHGGFRVKSGLIDVYPPILYPSRRLKPFRCTGIRGCFLNDTLRVVIHEILHKSGVRDGVEIRTLVDQYYKSFRRTFLSRFEVEFKPILKEWEKTEKEMGLR